MIEFQSVSKTFAGGTHAVQDLSLTIPSDKITVIVGPSGCGKTTTLRMINRMLEPSSGRLVWDGTPLKSRRKTTLRRQMGYVIQSGGLFPHRTVVENIGTVPGLLGWDKSKTRSRSMELLGNVGLDTAMAHRFPAQLSGGQQQRVGVARALAADPLVMLMDEPFSAVDPVVRTELHEFFLGLQREISKTIVLITHDIDEAIKLGDQVAILRVGGRLAQVGPPQQLLDEPADAFVEGFVGRDRGYRSLSFLSASGLRLDEIAVTREAASGSGDEPTLVLDGDARPVGWVAADGTGVHPMGATFVRESDTLRAALDSALTSPYGLAVALEPETGRYAGVVPAAAILSQVASERGDAPETVTLQAAEARAEQRAEAETAAAAPAAPAAPAEPEVDEPRERVDEPAAETELGPGDKSLAVTAEPPEAAEPAEPAAAAEPEVHADEPVTHIPVTDAPATDAPSTDAPAAEDVATDEPVADEPVADEPVADEPVTEDEQPTTIREPVIYTQLRSLPDDSSGSR